MHVKKMTHKLMIKAMKDSSVMRVLELGSGKSTFWFRNHMKRRGGFCLSLESDERWYDNLVKSLPDDEYGEVVYSPIICTLELGCRYDYELSGLFDLILIDGPGILNEEQTQCMESYLRKTHSCLNHARRSGAQSASLLDYVKDHAAKYIIVDCRKSSVMHYYFSPAGKLFKWRLAKGPVIYKKLPSATLLERI